MWRRRYLVSCVVTSLEPSGDPQKKKSGVTRKFGSSKDRQMDRHQDRRHVRLEAADFDQSDVAHACAKQMQCQLPSRRASSPLSPRFLLPTFILVPSFLVPPRHDHGRSCDDTRQQVSLMPHAVDCRVYPSWRQEMA